MMNPAIKLQLQLHQVAAPPARYWLISPATKELCWLHPRDQDSCGNSVGAMQNIKGRYRATILYQDYSSTGMIV
jgi:hypothetical protein